MGSCNCNPSQRESNELSPRIAFSPKYGVIHQEKARVIQSHYRAYKQRIKDKLDLKNRSQLQKRSTSTDAPSLEPKAFQKQLKMEMSIKVEKEKGNTVPIKEEDRAKSYSLYTHQVKQQTITTKVRSGSFSPDSSEVVCSPIKNSKDISPSKLQQVKNVSFNEQTIQRRPFPFKSNCILTHEPIMKHEKMIISYQSKNQQIKQNAIKLVGGNVYRGEWLNGLPAGKGKYTFVDQSTYIGDFKHGMLNGIGEFKSNNGCRYKGEWRNNVIEGDGIYEYENGTKYEGQWIHGLPSGYGEETYSDGSHYVGQFQRGMKHGYGKLTFSDGSVYQGQLVNDDMHGEGIYRWTDGRFYEGKWKYGKMHGKGQLQFPDGRKYIGEYYQDLKQGYGVFEFPDGKKYSGFWEKGLQHGLGEFYDPNKTQPTRGRWKKGKLVQLV